MAFDLETAKPAESGGFDLATAKPVAPAHKPGLFRSIVSSQFAVPEAALALGSGSVAAPIAGLAGIGQGIRNLFPGEGMPAGDRVSQIQEAMTYQPRTQAGQAVTNVVAYPFEKIAQGADWAGGNVAEITGSPALGAGVNTAIQFAVPSILKGVRAPVRNMIARAAERGSTAAALEAPIQQGLTKAREAGLAVSPTQAGAGAVARTVEGLVGEPKLMKKLSEKNAPVVNDLIRSDIGLPENLPASRELIAARRAEAGNDYAAVKDTGRVTVGTEYNAALDNITKAYDTAAKDFAHRSENPFAKVMEGLRVKSFDAASAVEEVKLLRGDADKAYRVGEKALGKAYKSAAEAMDNELARHVQRIGAAPDLVERYLRARETIAKTYAADKAFNETTLNFDASVYAKALKSGKKLTGPGLQVGEFARQFPRAAQQVDKIGPSGASFFDLAGAVLGKEALLVGARPVTRGVLSSGPYQGIQRYLNTPTYGPGAGLGILSAMTAHPEAIGALQAGHPEIEPLRR